MKFLCLFFYQYFKITLISKTDISALYSTLKSADITIVIARFRSVQGLKSLKDEKCKKKDLNEKV